MKVCDALEKACKKRGFEPERYHLESEDGETISENELLISFEEQSLLLVANDDIGMDEYIVSETKPMAYEEFRVTKQKKGFGGNQERILGIDYDRISNNMVEKKGMRKTKKPKTAFWLMENLSAAVLDDQNPTQFTLIFLESKDKKQDILKEYVYLAENSRTSKKIVSKINRILQMRKK